MKAIGCDRDFPSCGGTKKEGGFKSRGGGALEAALQKNKPRILSTEKKTAPISRKTERTEGKSILLTGRDLKKYKIKK